MYLRLHLSWPSCHIAHPVLSSHGAAMCDLNLETFDFFGEFNPLRVCEGFTLLVDIPYVQHFTHELYHWLRFVERSRRN